jgi:sugar phosphate isomerase/epimerase
MKIGMNRWFGYDISPKKSFELIKQAGFDNVILWWGDEFDHEIGSKELLPDMAKEVDLHIENVHMTFQRANALWEDTEETTISINDHISCIESCNSHGIPMMVMHLSKGYTPPEKSEKGLDNIIKIVECAEKNDIFIAIENIERMDYTDYVLDNIKSDKLRLCYDSGHDKCFVKSGFLEKYADKIITLHLHDNDGTSDHHMIPGDGTIDWSYITNALKDANYTGAITLECTNKGFDIYNKLTPEEYLEKAYKSAVNIAKLVEN